jgi:hypothetical protein
MTTGLLLALMTGSASAPQGGGAQSQPQVRVTGDVARDQAPGLTMSRPTISARGAQTILDAMTVSLQGFSTVVSSSPGISTNSPLTRSISSAMVMRASQQPASQRPPKPIEAGRLLIVRGLAPEAP